MHVDVCRLGRGDGGGGTASSGSQRAPARRRVVDRIGMPWLTGVHSTGARAHARGHERSTSVARRGVRAVRVPQQGASTRVRVPGHATADAYVLSTGVHSDQLLALDLEQLVVRDSVLVALRAVLHCAIGCTALQRLVR